VIIQFTFREVPTRVNTGAPCLVPTKKVPAAVVPSVPAARRVVEQDVYVPNLIFQDMADPLSIRTRGRKRAYEDFVESPVRRTASGSDPDDPDGSGSNVGVDEDEDPEDEDDIARGTVLLKAKKMDVTSGRPRLSSWGEHVKVVLVDSIARFRVRLVTRGIWANADAIQRYVLDSINEASAEAGYKIDITPPLYKMVSSFF
jgi:hypothetical protein